MEPFPFHIQDQKDFFRFRSRNEKKEIFDFIRKKWLVLQPEEWVRQNIIASLILHYKVPENLIAIEKGFVINQKMKRFDLVIFNRKAKPVMLIECKSHQVSLTQKVFDQMSMYNTEIKAEYLMATNGLLSYCCQQNHSNKELTFITTFPELL